MPHPLLERQDLIDLNMLDVERKDPVTPAPAERAHHWDPKQKNQLVYLPLVSQLLWSQRRLHNQKNSPLYRREDHWHPWLYPFLGGWVPTTPSRGCWLACEHTPGSPTGSYLLGVPAVDCLSLPSDRGGMISVPNPGHFPNIPTTSPAQTLTPTWLLSMDWWALSKNNAL